MNILIKNGTIVNPDKTFISDILINDGIISRIEENIKPADEVKVIDASGKLIFPGGIDPHIHMQLPTPAGPSSDDFYTGSKAALYGGTTTIIDFVTPARGQSLTDALDARLKEASTSLCDFSFHISPVEWRNTTESEIKECIKRGFTSFKTYMAYKGSVGLDDDAIKNVMSVVSDSGGIVTVHAEEGDVIDQLRNSFFKKGKTSPEYHALSRPSETEANAVEKVISFADDFGCPLYIVHVSSALSVAHIAEARKNGLKVYAETCPHYLLLDDGLYEGDFNDTVKYVISPPLRKKTDQFILWKAIIENNIDTIGTDHCPFNLSQKSAGINDFRRIPNGAGSIEHRLPLLYTYGVKKGFISLNKLTEVFSTAPAKIFGLYPQKGIIATGSDADIVIWNPDKDNTISSYTHKQNCDLEIFEGFKTTGSVFCLIKNGKIAIGNGEIQNETEPGKCLYRKPF